MFGEACEHSLKREQEGGRNIMESKEKICYLLNSPSPGVAFVRDTKKAKSGVHQVSSSLHVQSSYFVSPSKPHGRRYVLQRPCLSEFAMP